MLTNWCGVIVLAALPAMVLAQTEGSVELTKQARVELYAGRYENAVVLYQKLAAANPDADCDYELTRALLAVHRPKDAYAAGDEALKRPRQTPGTQTAAGLATFRKGEVAKAEGYFRAALKMNPKYAGALAGLAGVYATVSQNRGARDLAHRAYLANPEDPALMLAESNTMHGEEHIAMLDQALARMDPASETGRQIRAHVAQDRALHGRKVRRLESAYEPTKIKLSRIMNRPGAARGVGLRVQFNGSQSATLLLDTGASGISLTPKLAQKAGLEQLSEETHEARGIGDSKPESSSEYLASEVKIGNVVFADFPVSAFRSAKDTDIDGLIGTDVFDKFIITVNTPAAEMELQPYDVVPGDEPVDGKPLAPGFHRVFRTGNHMMIPTSVNQSAPKLFLLDSGASTNLLDAEAAREFTGVHRDDYTNVRGVQGKVSKVSRADRVTLVFAGFRQDNPDLVAIDLEKMGSGLGMAVTGVLGMPVLRQLKMTIDYREGAVRLVAVEMVR